MERVNIHIYPSPFKNESRMLKITKTLAESNVFDKIYIIATWEDGLPEVEVIDSTREIVRINSTPGNVKRGDFWKILSTLEWSWKIIRILKGKKIDCINCHNLQILPLSVFLKTLKHSKLIYDTHELETETANSVGFRKILSKIIERLFMPFIDDTIVVNEYIAEWYRNAYGLKKVWVVKNVPYNKGEPERTVMLKNTYNIKKNDILFLYQGLIGYGRGIELLLKIFSQLDPDKHIVFMGYGDLDLIERVVEYSEHYPNIHYHPAVKPDEIPRYTASADVGLSLIENVCLSYYLCLPNKLFEYMSCGIPVIVSDFPGMSKFIDEYGCGWKIPLETHAIISLIHEITQDVLNEKREKTKEARKYFGWHLEERTLLKVYKHLGLYR
ncbi:MAG: glycosyl transferase, group 1 family protein [Candidatus Jettenia ecosi]|uniref:Glycosyl transferase, group 1 family protein n=1 Tax=Candidatus Jettenia ecosi TaxID=2494326 RepID=A0A533Q8M6_9BACT|nr:MAG: glycosyl transferase, group 1 family protein [Candidatus Jettenia ecosi]